MATAVDLLWRQGQDAEICASGEELAGELAARLGYNPIRRGVSRVIEVEISRGGGIWHLQLMERERGQLVWSEDIAHPGVDCSDLREAAVIKLANQLLTRVKEQAPTAPPAAPTRPASPAAAPPAPAPSAPRCVEASLSPRPHGAASGTKAADVPSTPERWGGLSLKGGAALGLLPSASPAIGLSWNLGGTRVEGTAGMLWLPATPTSDGGFRFGLTALQIGGCVRVLSSSSASLMTCGGAIGGALQAVVVSVDPWGDSSAGDRAWAALSATPEVRIHLGKTLFAELGLDLLVPLTRYEFTAADRVLFAMPAAALLPFMKFGLSIP